MKQVIEVLKRRKWLFIIPFAVVFLLPVIYSLLFMRTYEANTLLWLDSDLSITSVLRGTALETAETTTIEQENETLQQLLESRTFVTSVIEKTPLKSKMDTPKGREKAIRYVQRNLGLHVVGPNALKITFFGDTREESVTFSKAISDSFIEWVKESVEEQNKKSSVFFNQRAENYRQELSKTRAELSDYKVAHPETKQLIIAERVLDPPEITVAPAIQAEFRRLTLAEQTAEDLYSSALTDAAQNRALVAAQYERYINGLRVVDEPVAPTSFAKKPIALMGFLAFVAAIIVAAGAVILAEYTDRSLHSEKDVGEALDLTVLTEVKDLADKRRL